MAQLYYIHPQTPQEREILKAVKMLQDNAIAIYPTDSVYGLGCRLHNKAGVERIAKLKGIKTKKQEFSFIFSDIDQIEKYSLPLEKWIFRLLKKNLPGAFTFILPASKKIPKILETSRKTIGIRIPDNNIIRNIVRILEEPILNTSVHDDDEIVEFTTDPELIYDNFKNKVDFIINGGYGMNTPTTVVDLSGNEVDIIRQGIGKLIY